MLMKRSRRYTPAIDCPLFPFGKTVCRTPLASRLTLTHTDPDLGRPTHTGQPGPGRIGDLRRIARAGPGGPGGQPRTEDGLVPQVVGASPAPPRGGRRRIHDHLTGARLSAAPQAAGLTGTRADAPPARQPPVPAGLPGKMPERFSARLAKPGAPASARRPHSPGPRSTRKEAKPNLPVRVVSVRIHQHHALPGTECGPAVEHWQRERG
jgi:hypothetical protein